MLYCAVYELSVVVLVTLSLCAFSSDFFAWLDLEHTSYNFPAQLHVLLTEQIRASLKK